jgi:hypothetical protein
MDGYRRQEEGERSAFGDFSEEDTVVVEENVKTGIITAIRCRGVLMRDTQNPLTRALLSS